MKIRRKITANYVNADSNFIICNIEDSHLDSDERPIYCVLNNILQRGCPTNPSVYLQELFSPLRFSHKVRLLPEEAPNWNGVIKGGTSDSPAMIFYYEILPKCFPEYPFIQHLLIPECPIQEIIRDPDGQFVDQAVDFYLHEARLVIEIDGIQHNTDQQRELDKKRDAALKKEKIQVVTKEDIGNDDELKTEYVWKSDDGKYEVLTVTCTDGEVTGVYRENEEAFWKKDFPDFSVDADKVYAELEKIEAEKEAKLEAEAAEYAAKTRDKMAVYTTRSGTYHLSGCGDLDRAKWSKEITYGYAKSHGYHACLHCNPDIYCERAYDDYMSEYIRKDGKL